MHHRVLATAVAALLSGPAFAEPITDLKQVTVTATRSEHTEADAPASVTVITAEEIRAKGATNVLEAIRGTPGITLTGRQVGGRKNVTIRGAEDRHTLFLIDGRRINSTDDVIGHSDYQYGWVSMDEIERIEIVRGPMSALYGSEAVGGVVNVITKKSGKAWRGSASVKGEMVDGNGGDSRTGAASIAGPLGAGFGLAVSVEDLRRMPVPLKENPLLSEIEGTHRQNAKVGVTFEPVDGHEFFVDIMRGREERWRDNRESSGLLRYYRDEYDLSRRQKSAGYRGTWGPVKSDFLVSRSDFGVTSTRDSGVTPTRPQELRDDLAQGNFAFALGDSNLVTVGGEYREELLKNAGLRDGSDSNIHKALYAQDEIELTDQWALTLGLRRDNHEIFGNELSPRAYLVWKATPELTIKGGYGEAFRAPTLKQISPSYVGAEGPHTFLGNAEIKPETSRSFELGANWSHKGTDATVTLFRNDIEDLIYTRQIAQVGPRRTYIYDNISRARIDGLEASGRQELIYGFSAAASYTYLYAVDRETGAMLTGRSRHSLNPSLDWTDGGWFASLSAEYVGAQYLTSNGVRENAPAYTLWNLVGSYDINDNATLRGGMRNIGDVRLAEESDVFGYSELGRQVFLGVDMKF